MTDPAHDYDDPLGYLNAIEAAVLKVDSPRCPYCHERRELIAMSGNGVGVEITHEPSCPNNEDNRPAAEFGDTSLRRDGE